MYKNDFSADKLSIYKEKTFSTEKEKNMAIGLSFLTLKILFEENSWENVNANINLCNFYELKTAFAEILSTLTEREKLVISLRYNLDGEQKQTYSKISEKFGCSPQYIHQIEHKALKKLRNPSRACKIKNIIFLENQIKLLNIELQQSQIQVKGLEDELYQTQIQVKQLKDEIAKLKIKLATATNSRKISKNESPIECLNLSIISYTSLKDFGIDTIEKLTSLSKSNLLNIPNLTSTCIQEINSKLNEFGITLLNDLNLPITTLQLSNRTYNALIRAGFGTLEQLVFLSKFKLSKIPTLGEKSITELISKLEQIGIILPDE